MTNEQKRQAIEMFLSWNRVFIAAILAQYMAGVTDIRMLFNAGLAAVVPVILRYIDPHDTTFGRRNEPERT